MTHKEIMLLQKNKYSYSEFVVLCADNGIDSCDTNQWGNTLSTFLFYENLGEEHEQSILSQAGGCCGGGVLR